ncbi:hypothetical protein yc1106_09098 [Curvularia clavata]|uniref:Uncharacterized protein n=1 Tax=Curvularia clavata TaxID=95742 RepID=A0A9Q8ZFQ7_CURCL|nr:hypothetical protein yc1106_09098 [Curvularia clavata]
MDTRYLELAARFLEDSVVSSTREPPKVKKGGKPPKKCKDDIELEGEPERSLLYSILAWLSLERDDSKVQPEEPAKVISDLGRLEPVDATRAKLPYGITSRIRFLESEAARLGAEDIQVKGGCKTTEYQDVPPGNQKENKDNDIKDAKEKAEGTKHTADGEEDKVKDATEVKQPCLASQGNMEKERGDALATIQKQKEFNDNLCAELTIGKCGATHVPDTAADANKTVAVTLLGFEDRRTNT